MKVGTVKEIKQHEYRVGLTPSCVKTYVNHGHELTVEVGAGLEAGFADERYAAAGAKIVASADDVFATCDMVVKVKEPQSAEIDKLREGQILYTYLHLAASQELTDKLLAKKITGVAYETIEEDGGHLPCLKPMSEIAGRLSVQEGAKYLEKTYGGRGVLLSGVPGVARGRIGIIGGGIVGANATKIAVGMGADVTVLDINAQRMAYLEDIFGSRITTLYSTEANIEIVLAQSDIIIGAVLIPGAKAPCLVRREHLSIMKKGAVIVDVAIDQGGCIETSRPTNHDDPIYVVDGIVHYCVTNMPGVVALTSTKALTSTTLPYGLMIADKGLAAACAESVPLAKGVNVHNGKCVHKEVSDAFGYPCANYAEIA